MAVRNLTVQSMHRSELGVALMRCHSPAAKSGRGPRPLFIIFYLQLGFSQNPSRQPTFPTSFLSPQTSELVYFYAIGKIIQSAPI